MSMLSIVGLLLLAGSSSSQAAPASYQPKSVSVLVRFDDRVCLYLVGGRFLRARDFARAIGSEWGNGVDIYLLTYPATPKTCIKKARDASLRAGLGAVRVIVAEVQNDNLEIQAVQRPKVIGRSRAKAE